MSYIPGSVLDPMVDATLRTRDQLLDELRQNLSTAQQRMNAYADQRRQEQDFQLGDGEYVKLPQYWQASLRGARQHKLSVKYFGPYQVIGKA